MKHTLRLPAAALCTCVGLSAAHAGDVMIETDPATFLMSGYAGHIRMRLDGSEEARRWVVGLGVYGMEFPTPMRKAALEHSPNGSSLNIRTGFGLFVDRFLSESGKDGLFAGLQVGRHYYDLKDEGQTVRYHSTVVMPRIGYHYEFGNGWYAIPWAGLAYLSPSDDHLQVQGTTVNPRHWLGFGTLHVGYRF